MCDVFLKQTNQAGWILWDRFFRDLILEIGSVFLKHPALTSSSSLGFVCSILVKVVRPASTMAVDSVWPRTQCGVNTWWQTVCGYICIHTTMLSTNLFQLFGHKGGVFPKLGSETLCQDERVEQSGKANRGRETEELHQAWVGSTCDQSLKGAKILSESLLVTIQIISFPDRHLLMRIPFRKIFAISCASPNSWMKMEPSWAWIKLRRRTHCGTGLVQAGRRAQTGLVDPPVHFHFVGFDFSFNGKSKNRIIRDTLFSVNSWYSRPASNPSKTLVILEDVKHLTWWWPCSCPCSRYWGVSFHSFSAECHWTLCSWTTRQSVRTHTQVACKLLPIMNKAFK